MKRDKLDTIFSLCIRESYDFTCVRCETVYPRGSQGLHCSHLFRRQYKSIRCCSLNAVAHCYPCHRWYGDSPLESGIWARNFLGETRYELLLERKNQMCKWNKSYRDELYRHWKSEYERLMKLRAQGVKGLIRLVDYD